MGCLRHQHSFRNLIARTLGSETGSESPTDTAQDPKLVQAPLFDGLEHLVFYDRGVGTGPIHDRLRGGAFGGGLARNIRRGAKSLVLWPPPPRSDAQVTHCLCRVGAPPG
jgi:uncharacterized protein (DUF2235 family)